MRQSFAGTRGIACAATLQLTIAVDANDPMPAHGVSEILKGHDFNRAASG